MLAGQCELEDPKAMAQALLDIHIQAAQSSSLIPLASAALDNIARRFGHPCSVQFMQVHSRELAHNWLAVKQRSLQDLMLVQVTARSC